MVRNKRGGNKGKKIARKHNTQQPQSRGLRLSKDKCEMYAMVDTMYGNGMCNVMCNDGVERLCIIRRKFKGRGKRDNFVGAGSWVLVGLREWEVVHPNKKPKCDLLEVYNNMEKDRLKKTKINFNFLLNSTTNQNEEEDNIEFVNEKTLKYENMIENLNKEKVQDNLIINKDEDEINIDDI